MTGIFCEAVVGGRYFGEDWAFAHRWRALGGEIWVDLLAAVNHTGRHVYAEREGGVARAYGLAERARGTAAGVGAGGRSGAELR